MSCEAIADHARLSVLHELGALDTEPEEQLDRFTALAADLLDAPASTITLLDEDRQFWKSAHGITGASAGRPQPPLGHPLCRQTVAAGRPLVLSDLRTDPQHGSCSSLGVVAYAGVPLVLADGVVVGTLCVIDHQAHEWNEHDLRILSELARAVSSMLDLRRSLNHQLLHDPVTGLPGLHAASRSRLRSALTGAVERGEIFVNFQPIVELETGETSGYEALARWRHPTLGLIGPSEFIPIAEATGEIVVIGEHVLRTACRQLALWRSIVPGDDLGVTVNLSPLQLTLPNIADIVRSALEECGLPGSALMLEITEKIFVSPGLRQQRNLEAIRALGVHIALDDFGTGYSALSYLKHFPVDMIKVDRCFLDGLETDRRDAALMRAILAIGSGMDLGVIAEGVETWAQREMLRMSGCRWGQGFLFSEPVPAEQIRPSGPRGRSAAPAGPSLAERIVAAPE